MIRWFKAYTPHSLGKKEEKHGRKRVCEQRTYDKTTQRECGARLKVPNVSPADINQSTPSSPKRQHRQIRTPWRPCTSSCPPKLGQEDCNLSVAEPIKFLPLNQTPELMQGAFHFHALLYLQEYL